MGSFGWLSVVIGSHWWLRVFFIDDGVVMSGYGLVTGGYRCFWGC